ncbi:MAG TPA: hypothetical protein VJN89_22375 [Candidatus Acidoferrum sp.]|nr:hypothetical protein [Candidatus Acidoferrum sp.]
MFRFGLSWLFAASLFLQAPSQPLNDPQFQSAFPGQSPGEVRFDPFQSLDWQQLAQRHLKDFSFSHPTPEQIARLKKHLLEHPLDETGASSEIQFAAPLEPAIRQGSYYAFSLNGIQPLQPVRLEGTMRYQLSQNKSAIVPDVFFGQVVAKIDPPAAGDHVFVIFSSTNLSFTRLNAAKFTARKAAKQDIYLLERDGKQLQLSVNDEGLFEVLAFTSFKIGTSEYVLVKWKPDSENHYGGCDRQYSLFVAGQELKLVATSKSGCDV